MKKRQERESESGLRKDWKLFRYYNCLNDD